MTSSIDPSIMTTLPNKHTADKNKIPLGSIWKCDTSGNIHVWAYTNLGTHSTDVGLTPASSDVHRLPHDTTITIIEHYVSTQPGSTNTWLWLRCLTNTGSTCWLSDTEWMPESALTRIA